MWLATQRPGTVARPVPPEPDLSSLVELLQLIRPEWQERAACRGADVRLFHPFRGDVLDEALAMCRACPVRAECRDYAEATEQHPHGIWGGESARQRMIRRRATNRAARLPS